jgi:hypothetical protein
VIHVSEREIADDPWESRDPFDGLTRSGARRTRFTVHAITYSLLGPLVPSLRHPNASATKWRSSPEPWRSPFAAFWSGVPFLVYMSAKPTWLACLTGR